MSLISDDEEEDNGGTCGHGDGDGDTEKQVSDNKAMASQLANPGEHRDELTDCAICPPQEVGSTKEAVYKKDIATPQFAADFWRVPLLDLPDEP